MNKLRKDKEGNMKALDKVFGYTSNYSIIGDKFHFIEAKENFL